MATPFGWNAKTHYGWVTSPSYFPFLFLIFHTISMHPYIHLRFFVSYFSFSFQLHHLLTQYAAPMQQFTHLSLVLRSQFLHLFLLILYVSQSANVYWHSHHFKQGGGRRQQSELIAMLSHSLQPFSVFGWHLHSLCIKVAPMKFPVDSKIIGNRKWEQQQGVYAKKCTHTHCTFYKLVCRLLIFLLIKECFAHFLILYNYGAGKFNCCVFHVKWSI